MYRGMVDEKRSREKREAWIRELEVREVEDGRERERRRRERERRSRGDGAAVVGASAGAGGEEGEEMKAVEKAREVASGAVNSSPLETGRLRELVTGRGILGQAMALWWRGGD